MLIVDRDDRVGRDLEDAREHRVGGAALVVETLALQQLARYDALPLQAEGETRKCGSERGEPDPRQRSAAPKKIMDREGEREEQDPESNFERDGYRSSFA